MAVKKLFLFLLFLSYSFSALIEGEVFLPDFSKPNISVMEINTTPKQTIVIFNGSYSLNLSNGSYNITVYYVENSNLFQSTETLKIKDDKKYILDFILLPYDLDEELLPIEDVDITPQIKNDNGLIGNKYFDVFIILVSLLILIYLAKKKFTKEDKIELPPDLILILKVIKANENRILQRELREELKWSEAKLSLALSELEHLGYIRRIKKGRGNIISLIKDYEEK